ncbi:proteasome subunit beta type 5 precursor, putative [Cryptosporidium muris RN66]|uniref:Proteasome subunit beta n=1 Tax=Cryptosporidium muris (strain RN66) TaxID=441375 RepID=B6A935_CRYMR|nr:proteasome subunit beta type 5 precursor, putative [Cryptosporidium muris RN66]EEA04726.1 proteasome subunit beta type 5 precursor, putative [Cryptosporidium muris RN66]|eukprot:XP_002139075.1 proteasome subunit beta type 5 precursor [Cryptosporidium muris RN66]
MPLSFLTLVADDLCKYKNIDPKLRCKDQEDDIVDKLYNNVFQIANVPRPPLFVSEYQDGRLKTMINKGTTTLGFIYQGGVILAVDSRATQGGYIASGSVKKIIEINNYLLGTMAGGAADCSYWERVLAKLCRLHELRNKQRISVAGASNLIANIFFHYRNYGLSAGIMISGYDKNGPQLYYVDNSGARVKGNRFSIGSGSVYAIGVLDSVHHFDLTDEDAIELGRRAITHATYRDGGSGGLVRVYQITSQGYKVHISGQDASELHYKYAEESNIDPCEM